MDRLSSIENELKNLILTIDGTTQPSGYQYYNDIDICNIEDEGWIASQNYVLSAGTGINSYPSVNIYLDPNEKITDHSANVYKNVAYMTLIGRVQNDDSYDITTSASNIPQNSKFMINKKMNELLSDIKHLFGVNFSLNGLCDRCKIVSSKRKYTQDNKVYRTGDIIINLEIEYTQSFSNPNLNVCY